MIYYACYFDTRLIITYVSTYIDTLLIIEISLYICMKAKVFYDRLSYTRKPLCLLAPLQNNVLSLMVRESKEIRKSCLR